MMKGTCGCGKPLPPTGKTGRCRSCIAKARYADPAQRAKMSQAKINALKDPVKRERVSIAAAATLRQWHNDRRTDPKPYRPRGNVAKVPAARRDEYTFLRRTFGPAEALRMILEDEIKKVHRRMGFTPSPDLGS